MLYALRKVISPLYKLVTEVMFWFVMYVNKSIKSTHRESVCFQGSNSVALFTFKNKYFSSCSRFGAHIVSTVILTNYEHTHKATTRQSVWNRFYWQSKIGPPICAPFGTKSYWAIQWSWFVRVNALRNLSRKKSREVAAHLQADFWVGVASRCV